MILTWRYTFSTLILLLGLAGASLAQIQIPPTLKLGTDLTRIGRTLLNEDYNELELKADLDFTKFMVIGDYGISQIEHQGERFEYSLQGNYYRLGLDYNLIGEQWRDNRIFVGGRYGWTNFNESMRVDVEDEIWGENIISGNNESIFGRWFEGVVGLKVDLFYNLLAGFTLRHKFRKRVTGQNEVRSFDIPGFGFNDQNAAWALNYYVFIKLGWKREKAPKNE